MTRAKKNPEDFELAPGITVGQFKKWRDAEKPERKEIAEMIKRRFEARFIEPVLRDGRVTSGFAAVALCCLAIQALDNFRHGYADMTSSVRRFIKDYDGFATLRKHEKDFSDNIRNALHHQAETTGGWRIHISGEVFDKETKIVGAQAVVEGFVAALNRYCLDLQDSNNALLWENFCRRMEHVIQACDAETKKP